MPFSPTSWPSGSGAFNGGTITEPLVIAPTDPNAIPLSIEASWNAWAVDFFRVLNTDTNTRMFAVDVSGTTKAWIHTSETFPTLEAQGTTQGVLLPGVRGNGPAGAREVSFYNAVPVALQTGVPVTAAGIHAALVALGLITA